MATAFGHRTAVIRRRTRADRSAETTSVAAVPGHVGERRASQWRRRFFRSGRRARRDAGRFVAVVVGGLHVVSSGPARTPNRLYRPSSSPSRYQTIRAPSAAAPRSLPSSSSRPAAPGLPGPDVISGLGLTGGARAWKRISPPLNSNAPRDKGRRDTYR